MHHEIPRFLALSAGSGHAIEPEIRAALSAAFDTDLSEIRIHEDAAAARLAAELKADAFASGTDIYFADGRYRPHWRQGLRLLAHEVAHVLQQAAGHARTDAHAGHLGGARYAALEWAAHDAADRVVAGRPVDPALLGVPVAGARRRPAVQCHASFEHRTLGDLETADIVEIAKGGPKRTALLEREANLQLLWHADPEKVTEEQLANRGLRTLRLRGSDLLVTYGELNALPDYLSSGQQADLAPKELLLPILQFIRQETYLQFRELLHQGSTLTIPFKYAVYAPHWFIPDVLNMLDLLGESMAIDDLTRSLGLHGTDHYAGLLARNACHFAPFSWHRWQAAYEAARVLAGQAHREANTDRKAQFTHDAWMQLGYADHFLQDSFAAGHLVNKTLIMQWFVEWAEGEKLVPVAEWDAVKRMTAKLQPGIAGRQLYAPDFVGISNDPQTAEEQSNYAARLAQTGLAANAGSTLDEAYQDYFSFLSSLITQSASGAIHDYYNEHSLSVASVERPDPYEVYGDHTLLSGANGSAGAEATSVAARLSQQSLAEVLNSGDSQTTSAKIRDHFPTQVKSEGNLLGIEQWNDTQKTLCGEQIFPGLHDYIVRATKPVVPNVSRDEDLAVRWSANLKDTGYTTTSVLPVGNRLFSASNGYIYELHPDTGAALHRLALAYPSGGDDTGDYETRLASDGNRLYVGVHGGVYGVNIGTGFALAWNAKLPDADLASVDVLVNGGTLVAGSNGHVHRLNPNTGHVDASLALRGSLGMGDYRTRLTTLGSTLIVGSHGWVYGVSLPALAKTWEISLPECGYHLVEVLVHNGDLFAGSNGFAYHLDSGSGKVQVSLRLTEAVGVGDYTTTLAADDNTLYVGTHGYVYGVHHSDWSEAAWEANLAGNRYSMVNLALSGNQLLAGSYGYVFRINPTTGAVVRSALLTMNVGVGGYETRVAFNPAGDHLYTGVHGYAYLVAANDH